MIRAAHEKGANLILVQEVFEGYYFCQAQRGDFFDRANPYRGHPTIARMQKLAKELGVVLPVSFFEEVNNAHYNSIAVIDADGTDLGFYRKSHIPDGPGIQSSNYFKLMVAFFHVVQVIKKSSISIQVFATKFAKIGVAMAIQGAEVLLYPTAIGSEPQDQELDSREHWKRVMQGHAGANLVPLVASNRIGKETIKTEHGDSSITFYGNSFITGPTGEILALANDKDEDVLVVEFDLNQIKSQRHSWGVIRDRRPELYKVLLSLDGKNTVPF
ncbi:N-carbamoylputrescine amidase protein [Dioscorea alata]|uniref:N-carbamoylputrescine amidase protein n=1 Tax=Dioscorea alata TaxID=55571 RepID=A0ACB7U6Q5_DIOAL|nr:N-carbamoylputrescine amidase protein [Dioscorea alata]